MEDWLEMRGSLAGAARLDAYSADNAVDDAVDDVTEGDEGWKEERDSDDEYPEEEEEEALGYIST